MRSNLIIQGIDAHTEGSPIRVITSGAGHLPGSTMVEKRAALIARDNFRRLGIFEPRGSFTMCAADLVEPTTDGADLGMLIMEPDTYPPMCGHCAIGVATVAVETGLVASQEGDDVVRLDTPAGVVPAMVKVECGRAVSVTLEMPTSSLSEGDARNVVICPPQVIDRSPCGTGTASRMALLAATVPFV